MTGNRFCVTLPWEVEPGVEVSVVVRGLITPYVWASRGEPAEGGELENLEIGNGRGCPLPAAIVTRLSNDESFLEAVTRLAEEGSEPDWDLRNKAEKEG